MAGRRQKSNVRDMALSMLVLLVPIVLIALFFTQNPEPSAEAVDVGPVLARAEAESPYPVLRAVNLPEGWVPTRVAWAKDGKPWIDSEPAVGDSWQLGYLAPNGIYVGLQQRNRAVDGFIRTMTRDGSAADEPVDVGGRTWERWTSQDDRTRSLVWRDRDMVAIVTGDAPFEQLEAFAGALATGAADQ